MVENPRLLAGVNKFQMSRRKGRLAPVTGVPFDEELAKETADYFVKTPHTPESPAVKQAYKSLQRDIEKQYDYATKKLGIKFIPSQSDPYKNSAEMTEDVVKNKRLKFYTGGSLPKDHPLSKVDPKTGLSYNNMFRAVHDLFGHATHGNQFGSAGERRAFLAHAQMMRSRSVPALAFETHAQNSFFNYGRHLRTPEGVVPKKGEQGFIPPQERPFAEQKAGVLPPELSRVSDLGKRISA